MEFHLIQSQVYVKYTDTSVFIAGCIYLQKSARYCTWVASPLMKIIHLLIIGIRQLYTSRYFLFIAIGHKEKQ